MNIGIDARLSGSKHAGIGRYTQNLIIQLIQQNKKDNFTIFFYDQKQADEVLANLTKTTTKKNKKIKKVKTVITPVRHYTFAEQKELPKLFAKENLDLLHVPHFNVPILYKGKLIITIHDLLWHEYKGSSVTTLSPVKYILKYLFYRLVTRIAVYKADKILVPAKTIKNTVIKFYPKVKNKIVITKEGSNIANLNSSKTSTKNLNKLPKLKNTFLYVGSLYPHKNLNLVLQALTSLTKYKLLIVGSRNVFQDKVKSYIKYKGIQDRVEFLGYVPDNELTKLYHQISALVQPSFSEGFGLTGVEAMSFGTSVLASDIPIFKEIYKDAAFYFSPHSTASFIQAVHALELNKDKRNTQGIKLSKTYSWTKMVEQTIKTYREILK